MLKSPLNLFNLNKNSIFESMFYYKFFNTTRIFLGVSGVFLF